MKRIYTTEKGVMYHGSCDEILLGIKNSSQKFNLIFTSPPFPLNRAKKIRKRSRTGIYRLVMQYLHCFIRSFDR